MSVSISSDIAAHQQLNGMVRDLTSSKQKLKIVQIITVIGLIFAVFSIGGSGYGVYYDMLLDYGHTPSLIVGAMVGLTIEAVKMVGVWGFFAYSKLHLKLIFFALLALFTTFAIQLHYIGAINMEVTKRVQVIEQVQEKNMKYREDENKRKDKIVELMGGVLQNGTSRDDKLAARTLEKIDAKEQSLYSQGKISQLDHEQIETVKDAAKKRGNSMRTLLPLFEIFSIFGLLGAYLKTQSVNENVKDVIDVVDTHIEKESAKLYADRATSFEEAEELTYVKNKLKSQELGFNAPAEQPKPKSDWDNFSDAEKAAIMAHLRGMKGGAETYKQSEPAKVQNAKPSTDVIALEERFARFKEEPAVEECVEEDDCIDAEIYTTINNQKVRAIDYKTYNDEERAILMVMYDNGDILPGEHLVKRIAIVAELKKKIKNVGEILTALNGKLQDKGHIEASPRGYKAKSALLKELWQEVEE